MSELVDDSSLMMVNDTTTLKVYSPRNNYLYDEGKIMEQIGDYLEVDIIML